MRPITVASLFKYNQHDMVGDRKRQGFQHPLLKNMPLLLFCLIQKLTTHSSLLTAHYSSLICGPIAVPRPSDGIIGVHLIPRVKEPATIRLSDATPSGRGIIMKMRLEDRIFHISMRRGNVGTSACSVRGSHSLKSRQSRQRFRVIFVRL